MEPNDPQTREIQQKPNISGNKLQPPPDNVSTTSVINVNAQIRSQLFSVFIDSYVPSSTSGQISFRCQKSSNLIESFPPLMDRPRSQLLDRAIAALASVFVGKKFNDNRMTNNGIRIYNQAIQIFGRLIPRSDLPVQEVLCANLIFQLYEVNPSCISAQQLKYLTVLSLLTAHPGSLDGWHTWRVPMPFSLDIIRNWKKTRCPRCYYAT